jgi:GTP cyclohydrolase I
MSEYISTSLEDNILTITFDRPDKLNSFIEPMAKELQEALGTEDVACVIDAKHLCVNSRGIRDVESSTVTSEYGGKFKNPEIRRDFLDYINLETSFS